MFSLIIIKFKHGHIQNNRIPIWEFDQYNLGSVNQLCFILKCKPNILEMRKQSLHESAFVTKKHRREEIFICARFGYHYNFCPSSMVNVVCLLQSNNMYMTSMHYMMGEKKWVASLNIYYILFEHQIMLHLRKM